MELSVTLSKEQWEYILEVIDLSNSPHIKSVAIALLKPQLDEQFQKSKIS